MPFFRGKNQDLGFIVPWYSRDLDRTSEHIFCKENLKVPWEFPFSDLGCNVAAAVGREGRTNK